jgi:hypothetical protein
MTPVNNKSLIAFIFDQMEKLDNQEITVEQAKAQSNLAKQVNNSMKYELDLVNTKIKVAQHNEISTVKVELRNAESKNFE